MRNPFRARIRVSLANPSLRIALDNNAQRRISARLLSYASLPDEVGVMRKRAHAMRADVVANLDYYLERFVTQAQANGLIVHRAEDAAQAVQIVLGIASRCHTRLVAKAKSMISEEIGLNAALEAAGIEVVETDLGEYIVQLRGEHPAHIITPAVHLRREDVGQTFHEKLGIPYTDDVPTLTSAARDRLRQVFLDADMGISGVNFGVAETGMLCLVTNEGNGRLVTTLPPVHVALMGIERLVPSLDDLALMLYLLPRAASGQKLTAYVSLIRGPSAPSTRVETGDRGLDGPRDRHLILVDNGRSGVRHSPLADALHCIRCGSCLNACPVFREIGGHAYVGNRGEGSPYSGPIGSAVSPALFGQSRFGHLARASSLCGACKEACPVDIDIPLLLLRVRAGLVSTHTSATTPKPASPNAPGYLLWALRFFSFISTSGTRFAIAQRLVGLAAWLASPMSRWLRMPAFSGWGYSKDLARPALRPFRAQWQCGRSVRPEIGEQDTREREINGDGKPVKRQPEDMDRRGQEAGLGSRELVTRFGREVTASGGTFITCRTPDLARCLLDLLQSQHVTAILSWEAKHFPPGLLDTLEAEGIQVLHKPDSHAHAGLTAALAGVAETGTLVLPGSADRPLTASILPRIHVAVLRACDIYEQLSDVLNLHDVREASAVAMITGPSRTADIEMTLTVGMHGPAQVFVFCLADG